jgi:hypothetical protein
MEVLPRTTHLLSNLINTKKVIETIKHRSHNCWILHPDWLLYCRWSLCRAQESTFMMNNLGVGQNLPVPVMNSDPITVIAESTSSSSVASSSSRTTQSPLPFQLQRPAESSSASKSVSVIPQRARSSSEGSQHSQNSQNSTENHKKRTYEALFGSSTDSDDDPPAQRHRRG